MQKASGAYTLSKPKVLVNNPGELEIESSTTWFTPVIGGLFFGLIGIALLVSSWRTWGFFSALAFGMAIFFLFSTPYRSKVTISRLSKEIVFSADYVLHFPRNIRLSRPVAEILQVSSRLVSVYKYRIVEVLLKDGVKVMLNFEKAISNADLVEKSIEEIRKTAQAPGEEPENDGSMQLFPVEAQLNHAANLAAHGEMLGDFQSWTRSQFFIGILQFISAGGFSAWGVVLLSAAVLSIFVHEAVMYLVYAVTIALAGISNLVSPIPIGWKIFALFQFWLAYTLVKKYRQSRKVEQELSVGVPDGASETSSSRGARFFPWAALGFGVVSIAVFGCGFLVSIIISTAERSVGFAWIAIYINAAQIFSSLGLTAGIASLVAQYPRKPAAIVGVVTAALTTVILYALTFIR